MKYHRIITRVVNTPWAITPEKMGAICDMLAFQASGHKYTAEEVKEILGDIEEPEQQQRGQIVTLPLFGTVVHRADMFSAASGGTSTESFAQDFHALLDNPDVAAIVIDVDSGGGVINGVPELSRDIYDSRGRKPIVSVANSLAASAAYWIASAADEMYVIPSGEVGSIGVYAVHKDMSKALEKDGITVSLISAGENKAEGHPSFPLTEEAREHLQERVDEYYEMFVSDVARNRGVERDVVLSGYGQGRIVGAAEALAVGMVDGIATLDDVMGRLAAPREELSARKQRLRLAQY